MKFVLKAALAIIIAVVIAVAVLLTNVIWFRPWNLNLFYEKAFLEVIFNEPELLTSLGLVEQSGISSHEGKLNDASPAHQQAVFDRWEKNLRQLHQYPLDRQTASQKLAGWNGTRKRLRPVRIISLGPWMGVGPMFSSPTFET